MQKIIDQNLRRLERILGTFDPTLSQGLPVIEKYSSRLALMQLRESLRLMQDTKTLLQATGGQQDPVFLSLLESAAAEMQSCWQVLQAQTLGQQYYLLSRSERKSVSDALLSGIIALQLFIAP